MRNDFLNSLKEMNNFTYTENGAVALKSTNSAVLDAFARLGAMKDSDASDIIRVFEGALIENQELAMRLLFYIRDIRGGQGMRRVFRVIITWLANKNPELVVKNFDNFLFFGRGDDLLCLIDSAISNEVMTYIVNTLHEDMQSVNVGNGCSLLAKWMPSINTSSVETRILANKIREFMGINAKQYRLILKTLREAIGIVESKMSRNAWEEIDFEKLPAKASMIYRDAFMKHNYDGYYAYLKDVASGKAKVNAASLFPVDIVHNILQKTSWTYNGTMADKIMNDAQWNALPNYFGDSEETGMCVVDVSSSMYGTPMEVAIALGIYCADKAKGPFKNNFITFESNPSLVTLDGCEDITDKVKKTANASWGGSTNLEAVFNLILNTAIRNHLKQEDMPSKLYIISDMQFNEATRTGNPWGWHSNRTVPDADTNTLIKDIEKDFNEAGYQMPALVYWNVRDSHCGMFQDTKNGNCCMVSGYSASLFKAVIEGTEYVEVVNEETGETTIQQKLDPITIMTNTLMNERYDRVYTGVN